MTTRPHLRKQGAVWHCALHWLPQAVGTGSEPREAYASWVMAYFSTRITEVLRARKEMQ